MAARPGEKRKKTEAPRKLKPRIRKNGHNRNKKSKNNPNFVPLGKNEVIDELKDKVQEERRLTKKAKAEAKVQTVFLSTLPAAEQLSFFIDRFQSANGFKMSPLEMEAYKDNCMVELPKVTNQDIGNLSKHLKDTFGTSWREVLCDAGLSGGMVQPGSPALLIISVSALRSLEFLRGLKIFTRDCRPAKLFAKHMKVEEQVELLKGRVNIASGTPSRIKKLIDIDALLLSRLALVVLDVQSDAKGYSLFTLPQVSMEFWDLYRSHFNERIIQGSTRICFYGAAELKQPRRSKHGD